LTHCVKDKIVSLYVTIHYNKYNTITEHMSGHLFSTPVPAMDEICTVYTYIICKKVQAYRQIRQSTSSTDICLEIVTLRDFSCFVLHLGKMCVMCKERKV